ncbi:MAG TPA: PIG-L deacetylase family protein [Dehalococcoidia bacterium]|nr:PIG-L deacetylase family protein [Dehalococcoidia bacterium]
MTANLESLYSHEELPMTMPDTDNKVALVVAAHPDDADFGAAGTSYLWSREGWTFYYLVCTDGSKGTSDPHMDPSELIRLRRDEQREAARRAGVSDVFFLDYVDGELTYTRDLLGDVVRHIRMLKPYAVFTHEPEAFIVRNSFVNHSDHRCTGQVTIDAIYPAARDRLNFPEHLAAGLETHNVKEIYIWGSEQTNFEVDISECVEQKIHALQAHVSQGFGAEDPNSEFLKFVRERWRGEDGRYTERFRRVVLFR